MTNRIFPTESPRDLRLDVVIMRESVDEKREVWVAQCLQYDIATQAATLEQVSLRIQRVVIINMILALENGETPFANLKPAPERYWKEYRQSKMQMQIIPVAVPADRIPSNVKLTPSRIPRGEATLKFSPAV
jgi:hypothetical protein